MIENIRSTHLKYDTHNHVSTACIQPTLSNPTQSNTRTKPQNSTSHPRRPNPPTTTASPPPTPIRIPPPSPQRLRPNTPLISQRLPPQLPHNPIARLQLLQSLRSSL